MQNQQNTSNKSVDSSQIDDSKDSSYNPSKESDDSSSSSSEEPTVDESAEVYNNDDDDEQPYEDALQEPETDETENKCENIPTKKVIAKDYININVPSGKMLSPKSRQKCISEYAQVIGDKGVQFTFAGH